MFSRAEGHVQKGDAAAAGHAHHPDGEVEGHREVGSFILNRNRSRDFRLAVSFIKSKSKKIGNTGCCIRFRFRRSIRDLLKKFDIKCRTKYLPGFACSSEV